MRRGKSTSFPFVIFHFLTHSTFDIQFPSHMISRYYFFDFIHHNFAVRCVFSHVHSTLFFLNNMLEQFNIIHKSYHTIHIFWFIHVEQTFPFYVKFENFRIYMKYGGGGKAVRKLHTPCIYYFPYIHFFSLCCIINFIYTRLTFSFLYCRHLSLLLPLQVRKRSTFIWFINYYVTSDWWLTHYTLYVIACLYY